MNISEALALGGLIGLIIAKAVQSFMEYSRKHKIFGQKEPEEVWDAAVSDIQLLNHMLREALIELGAVRVFVAKCHNGGSTPSPSHPVFITVVNEYTRGLIDPVAPFWQATAVDHPRLELMMKLAKEKQLLVHRAALTRDSMYYSLSNLGVDTAVYSLIAKTESEMYYLVVHFSDKVLAEHADKEMPEKMTITHWRAIQAEVEKHARRVHAFLRASTAKSSKFKVL